jgi:MFS superfamily sulfate permease-like transporter
VLDQYTTDPTERQHLASLLTLEVGVFTLALGLVRFGFMANILCTSMLHGFMNAVAIEVLLKNSILSNVLQICLEQVDKFFGVRSSAHSYMKFGILSNPDDLNMAAFGIGLVSLFILVALRLIKSKFGKTEKGKYLVYIPDPLVVVAFGIIFSKAFDWGSKVPVLGKIQTGLGAPHIPVWTFSQISDLTPDALFISIVGIVESSLIARTFSIKHAYRISVNRELVALGN